MQLQPKVHLHPGGEQSTFSCPQELPKEKDEVFYNILGDGHLSESSRHLLEDSLGGRRGPWEDGGVPARVEASLGGWRGSLGGEQDPGDPQGGPGYAGDLAKRGRALCSVIQIH